MGRWRRRIRDDSVSIASGGRARPTFGHRCFLIILTVYLITSLACALPAIAQGQSSGPATPPEKSQPPPLFPKHRRGVYRNSQNNEVSEEPPKHPPLEIDDPGVPDKGEFEINLLTAADSIEDARNIDVLRIDANYGLVL